MRPILVVPGIGGSGPAHWQSLWQAEHTGITHVTQRDWDHPLCDEWVESLDRAIRGAMAPPIVIAHSLGCLTLAHWAARSDAADIAATVEAMLVAIPDPDGPAFPREAAGFSPVPQALPLARALVVSSSDDPYATTAYTDRLVAAWGAEHLSLGRCGHINADSGLGDWPQGWTIVHEWRQG